MATRNYLRRPGWLNVLALVGLALGLGASTATAQVLTHDPFRSGIGQVQIPAQGEWARVLTVTDRWLVLEDEQGRQFPVNVDAIQLFMMRWPTSLERIGADALIEVTGLNLGSNQVQADHLDVFTGSARNLVVPTVQHIIGLGRVLTPFDFERMNTFGINWQYNLMPGEEQLPRRLHVVAPPVQLVPLQLAAGGNNVVTVVPAAGGLTMTQVTPGSFGLVRPGDLAYCVANLEVSTARSLALPRLVIYKTVPPDQLDR